MKCILGSILLTMTFVAAFSQTRDYRIHQRGMLHETEYNTGEIGRGYDNGVGGVLNGFPSMEWPPNSSMIISRTNYAGQHNSFGGGLWLAGTRPDTAGHYLPAGRQYIYCGAISDANGNPVPTQGVVPISIDRIENYPVLASGELNSAYDPNEAEERIVAKWSASPLGVIVTRTSRAWSYPGYDSFIIYEYELDNTTADTIKDLDVVWTYGIGPSMFGYERTYNRWGEGDYRGQNGEGNQFGRFDLKRWMTYNHDREGRPDTTFFNLWSQPGDRGGLNSPQAAGLMMLYYDYDHIATRTQTQQVWPVANDSVGIWDANGRVKQPFLLRFENGNIPQTKTQVYLDPRSQRKTGVFVGSGDSTRLVTQLLPSDVNNWSYWRGRTKGSTNLMWYQPVVRAYGFYPYILPPGVTLRFAVAEVVGYGPGVATDRIYTDLGGNIRAGVDAGAYFNPVPSWYDTLQYPYLGSKSYIGSQYLRDHPLPWYVTPGVVSIRDVADRAIQMFTGQPLVKHDSLQYEPVNSRPNGIGAYNTIPIPVPSPAIRVTDTRSGLNKITWGPQVEAFSNAQAGGRLRAPFKYYLVMRSTSPLGPWAPMDSVGRRDPRFFQDSVYVVFDSRSILGSYYYYSVLSVDSLGGRSGIIPNVTTHITQAPAVPSLGKVYAIPNPLVVTNGDALASDPTHEATDRVYFYGLTKHCTIRVFSYSGQLIETIHHDDEGQGGQGQSLQAFFQVSRNSQLIASGVYFFVVEDAGGARANGKFVIIH